MGKIKEFFTKSKKRLAMSVTAALTFALGAVGCFAVEPGQASLTTSITSITGALTDFSASNLMLVVAAGLGIAVPLVLAWFAFRWIYKKAKGALKRGS